MDLMCGSYWYEAPDWKQHFVAEIEASSGYYNDFANLPQDVDGDGDLDIVSVTWFSKEVLWRENPGKADEPWTTHSIDTPGNVETAYLYDITGNGTGDLLANVMGQVTWYEKIPGKAEWIKHMIGEEGAGHGIGAGDLNGDGVTDIICPNGWYEGKKDGDGLSWTWRPDFWIGASKESMAVSVPVLVHDVNRDGRNDIVWGMGHDYGLFWMEQTKGEGKDRWKTHLVEKSWSQVHYLWFIDLDKDGREELVTGKRYYAHNGHDPGGNDPLCIYVYTYDKAKNQWTRHIVDEGTKAGFGLNPAIGDIDGDGDIDLLCPGKSGLFYFELVD